EARGTKTYLHVPSPGLLDLFLKEGARRFVFEGRECGGHVGPRSSFALWEAQIERLLQDDDPGSLHVLFAGGIHDARSAAMVSAMTATLAARGAKIGALMGTAYLFTEEAVATGAIKERFQREAIACDQTVLLETAPGHATRCAETNYVRAFTERRQQLEAEGRSSKDVWAELEQLNLGRLRIASKGIVRDGDQLLEVSDEDQGRDGMYMLGQVASMRDATCTMAELHRDVCEGARGILAQADVSAPASATPAEQTDIAIVGMACMFPDAPDLAAFWRNIIEGRNSITEVDPERWDPAVYYDPEATGATAGEKTPSKWGGFLSPVALNPLDYGIPPKSLASIEPVQLLALDVARRALADAGYAEREFARERASVIFGAEAGTELSGAYGFRAMFPQVCGDMPDALDHALPDLSEDSFPGVLANVIAGRIANRLDLGGVNYTVDAACASSLAAVDLAVKELSGGTSDLVLCGGADLHNSINDFLLFSSVHALSPTGQCRTFSEDADGIALGEGVACVALKRLDDARRDGDRVYAVIKGIAGSSDGRSLGLTAPRAEGQKRALTRAYDRAGVSPAEVGLVEAHGTGTVVGDRTELSVLEDVYATAGAEPGHVTLGSVKSQIGHTKCAAGMAGLIKSALAIYTGTRPGTLNITAPNPAWDAEESPFAFGDGPRPWLSDSRKAALSALGFGGTNFHAVLSEADAETAGAVDAWPAELFVFRGETREDALEQIRRVRAYVQADPASRLRDIARTLATTSGPTQVAVVASDAGDLLDALDLAERFEAAPDRVFVSDPDLADGQLAFLFPGQGSQRPNMLADVFASFPYLKEWLRIGPGYADRIFPPAAFTSEERRAQRDALKDTRVAQPALGMVDTAMAQLVRSLGVEPDMLAGHSYGELAALSMAGAFDAETLVAISEARAACILDAAGEDPGTMAAVAAPAEAVRAALEGHDVVLANLNAPRQTVIAGTTEAIGRAVAHLEREGLAARSIPVACAFHSPLVSDAEHSFGQVLASRDIAAPVLPVWSNVTAGAYEPTAEAVRSGLSRQVAETVRWADQVLAMHEAGARVFVEVGPGQVLSGLVSKILGDRPHAVVPCDRSGAEPLRPFLGAVAQLAALGIPVDLSRLFEGRDANLVDLSTAPAGPAATAWWVDGHTARPVHGEAPAEALRPFDSPVPLSSPHVAESPAPPATTFTDPRDAAVIEYLRSMRELAAAQRDVVLGYLGTTAAAVPTVITTPTVVHTAVPTAARALPAPAPPTPAEPAVAAPVPEATPEPAASVDLEATLVGIVSERTGYPPEMLDLDLDLEAELSIDSIKRIEILGVLRETIDLTPPAGVSEDDVVEELAAKKTLRGILEWIESNTAARDNAPVLAEPSLVAGGDSTPSEPLPVLPLRRYAVRTRDAAPLGPADVEFAGRRFMVVDDGGGVADAVAALLTDRGASADVVAREDLSDSFDRADGLIDLDALAAGADASLAIRQFARARSALGGGAQIVVLTSALGGRFGDDDADAVGGTSGLGRTLAREYPGALVRVVDLDPGAAPAETATALVAEMETLHGPTEVGIRDQHRVVRVVEEDPLDPA
ncbi:MAG: beta-ketoacyl synthase N-terminal-like domain-containing protein, partial [Bacteroidota bacterium]